MAYSKKIRVSVIIPTFNRDKVLVETIKSVLKQQFSQYELIIIDQTPKHDRSTTQFLRKHKDRDFTYYLVSPPSLPAARNFGLTKAQGEIVIFIDDDVRLDPGFIKAHWESYQNHNAVSVVGKIKEKTKPPSKVLMYFRKTGFGAGNFNYPSLGPAETVQGCNMSFKRQVLIKTGGFDTNYIGNAVREESDVSFRLTKLGYQTIYNPKASLYHRVFVSGGCREDGSNFDNYIQYRNEFLFFLRHMPKGYLPYFFGGHIYRYVFNRDMLNKGKVFLRLKMFMKGVVTGTIVYLFPRPKVTALELPVGF